MKIYMAFVGVFPCDACLFLFVCSAGIFMYNKRVLSGDAALCFLKSPVTSCALFIQMRERAARLFSRAPFVRVNYSAQAKHSRARRGATINTRADLFLFNLSALPNPRG